MRLWIKTGLSAAAGLFALAFANAAAAQCNSGCQPPAPPPPACCQPPAPPPPPPSPPNNPCCRPPQPPTFPGGGDANVNVNVNVNGNLNGNWNGNSNSNYSTLNARSYDAGFGGGGGGGGAFFSVEQPAPTVIQGLNVEAQAVAQVVRVPFQASRWAAKRVVIRAVCIDDRNVPHPASQVQPGQDVHDGYAGELYRCIAGSRMQITVADLLEQISFDHGESFSCQKGESLWYGPGAGGAAAQYAAQYAEAYAGQYGGQGGPAMPMGGGVIECRPQKPERDCNERSLLRRYGAGIKVLTLWREEMFMSYREEVVQAAGFAAAGSSLVLDGGVGGRVF